MKGYVVFDSSDSQISNLFWIDFSICLIYLPSIFMFANKSIYSLREIPLILFIVFFSNGFLTFYENTTFYFISV